jgi:hypothetical protein
MQAAPEAFDDNAGAQFEISNRHQRLGVNEPRFPVWQGVRHNAPSLARFASGYNCAALNI